VAFSENRFSNATGNSTGKVLTQAVTVTINRAF